jgi:hypothetical protein
MPEIASPNSNTTGDGTGGVSARLRLAATPPRPDRLASLDAATSPRAAGRGEKSKSALAARARPSSANAKSRKALPHDPVRSSRRWDRRRHDHVQQSPIRGPDEPTVRPEVAGPMTGSAKSGIDREAFNGDPDFHFVHPGYERKRRARRASAQTSVRKSAHTKSTRRAACRRSTAALAAASQRRSSAPDALPGTRSSCPSPASSSQAGHSAGRALLRSRPGAQVTSPRPREPLPLHRPVSPADVLDESEIRHFL